MSGKNFVAGIGGAFIYSFNPKELAEWYSKNLGIPYEHTEGYNAFYYSFYHREDENPDKRRYTVWSIGQLKEKPEFKGKLYTINYRVNNMDETVDNLKSNGIEIKGPEVYPEGIFAWIKDLDGNSIELWEDTPAVKPEA